jgi:hypothetical protein
MTKPEKVPPPHGRLEIPKGCLCRWVYHPVSALGPEWWQMSERLRGCHRHRFPEEKTVIDQAEAVLDVMGTLEWSAWGD